jgi:hypothetical protein
MKKFKLTSIIKSLLFAFLVIGSFNYSYAQVDVAATAGTPAGTYATLKGAFDAINAGTHQGNIAIGISANTTETASAVLNGSGAGLASYTAIIISPSADGVVISGATLGGKGVIELNGADNVTINGDNPNTPGINRNLEVRNTAVSTTTYTSVVRIAAFATVITSADNNTISNLIITGSASDRNVSTATSTTGSESTTNGIYIGSFGSSAPASATATPLAITSVSTTVATGATMNNLIITNNQVTGCARGISVQASSITVINNLTISNNVIGAATAGSTTTVYRTGITAQGFTAALISGNTIRNIEGFIGTSSGALAIGDISSNGTNAVIENNIVSNKFSKSLTTYGSYGINFVGGNGAIIRNNFISDVKNDISGGFAFSTSFGVFGIRIAAGTNHKIYHNSVNLFGARIGTPTTTHLAASFAITATAVTGCDVRNNIFTNTMGGGSGTTASVCVYLPNAATSALNLTLNNNAYYTGSVAGVNGIAHCGTTYTSPVTAIGVGLYAAADFNPAVSTGVLNFRNYTNTLSAAATNDNASFASSNAAPFISSSDLHLLPISPELINVEQKGAAGLVGVTTDIDGNTRPDGATTFPDMGADEVTAPLACSGTPTAGTISGTSTICQGGSVVLTSNGIPAEAGLSFQWASSTTLGGPYTTILGSTLTQNTGALAATTYYVVTVTCANGGLSASTPEFTVNVNANPIVAVTPSSATYCNPGTAVDLAASGASTYAWTPSTGLSANIGAAVAASPTTSTTYTVTGVDGNGCIGTALVPINVVNTPTISAITATPTAVCNSGNSQLQANVSAPLATDYLFSAGTSASLDPMVGATTVINSLNDDTPTAAPSNIGFSFPFNGTTYTQYSVSPDGWLLLGGAVALSDFSNQVTDPTNIPKIYPLWDDLATGTTGNVQTLVTGTAPNQIFIVQWSVTVPRNTTGPANSTFQAWLYENTGVIEFRYGTIGVATGTMSAGLTGSTTNYKSITFVTNTASSSVPNDNNTVVPVNGTIYTFTPPTYTYSWSPATFLNSTTITNPLATGLNATTNYTLSALANGCTTTATVTVTANPLPTAPTTTSSAQCGAQIPTASVVSTSGLPTPTFVWYDAAVAGTVLQTSTSTTYTSVVPSTTTLYVSELNTTTGCESTLTPVTITVASADLVQASIDLPTICIGQSVNLSVVNTNPSPLQSYTYTWSSTTGNGLVTSTGSAVTATPSTPGSYVFTVNGVDGGCNAVSSVNLTVNPFTATLAATNVTCFNAGDGSFSLTGSSCGTAPFSYSVDGGAFGPIPTNLTPGTYSVVTRDANLYTVAPQTIVITQPAAVNQPVGITNVSICEGVPSAQLVYTPVSTGSVTLPFALLAQPTEVSNFPVGTVAVDPNIISSATMPALPANAVITSVNFTFNNITATGGSWRSDVNFGFNGAVSSPYAVGAGALNSAGNFNYTLALSPASVSIAGGVVNLHYFDAYNDNAGSEATFPIGANVASMVINYTYTPAPSVAYYAAPTGGTSLGTGTPFETVGTSVLLNTNTPGVYNFYAAGVNGICESAARSLVTVTVNALPAVNAGTDQTVCEGDAVTLSGTVAGGTWSGPVAVTNGTAFTPPAGVHTFTYSVTNVAGCTSTDDVVVTVNALPVVNAGTDQTICEGASVTLSGTVAGGTWNGPVVIADGVAFTPPAGVHTFTYSVTNAASCTNTDNVVVTVNALPVVNAGTDQTICEGEAVTLNGTDASGTWSGPVAVTNGTAFTPPAGVHTFTYSVTNVAGCTSTDDVVVTVNTLPTVDAGVDQTVCEGDAVTLSGTVAGGTWNGPVVIADGVAFTPPAGVHTFTYSVTNAASCTNTDDVVVTVNALPVVNAGVDQTVCEGDAVLLSGTVAGGTWNGPVVIADGVAFTPPAGVHTFTYSVTNVAGCTSTDDVVVTVNTLPTADAGADQTICEGEAVTLSGNPTAGTWTGPVTIADGVAFTPPVGIHTFTYSVTNVAGCTDTDDVIVTVNAAPVADAGADLAVCDGEEVTFNGTGGTSPTWTGPVAVTNGTPVVLPVGVHVFNLTITGSNGCTDTDAIQVTVNALPTAVATDNLDATISASAGATYQWIDCATNLPIAGATAQTYTVTANGSYAVIVNNGTCEDTSDCVVIDYIGINEVSQDMISVYPNPTRDFVTVNMTAANASIEVVDAQGKILQTSIVENGGTLSLASYETGMYIFRITTENGTSIHRISKN